MNVTTKLVAALFASAAIAPAQAGHFIFHYEADPDFSDVGSPMSATLYLTTSDALDALGGYDILSASGTIDGNAVTGLVANPNQPDQFGDGLYIYDNVLYTSGPALDPPGLAVNTAGLEFNFGYDGGGYYAIGIDGTTHLNSHGQTIFTTYVSAGDASLAAVPEPAAWMMMVTGFGMAGAAMRRRRATVSFA